MVIPFERALAKLQITRAEEQIHLEFDGLHA